MDWTADYRLYSEERIDCRNILTQIRKEVQALNAGQGRLITALDDSLLIKTGKKIPGVKYARDPMGPPFQVNFESDTDVSRGDGRRTGQNDTGGIQ